jgi:hypothetical protein
LTLQCSSVLRELAQDVEHADILREQILASRETAAIPEVHV